MLILSDILHVYRWVDCLQPEHLSVSSHHPHRWQTSGWWETRTRPCFPNHPLWPEIKADRGERWVSVWTICISIWGGGSHPQENQSCRVVRCFLSEWIMWREWPHPERCEVSNKKKNFKTNLDVATQAHWKYVLYIHFCNTVIMYLVAVSKWNVQRVALKHTFNTWPWHVFITLVQARIAVFLLCCLRYVSRQFQSEMSREWR